jgi:uncharacterized protein (DUF433 family)
MADLDWNQCDAVESVPDRVSGAWTFKDSRTPVSVILANLAGGATLDEVVEWFPVTRKEVESVLLFLAATADAPADRATAEILRVRVAASEMDHAHSV